MKAKTVNKRIDLVFKAAAIVLMAALLLRAAYLAIASGMVLGYFAVALSISILIFIFSPEEETDNAFGMAMFAFIILAMIGGIMMAATGECGCFAEQKEQAALRDCVKNEICSNPVNLQSGK